MLSFSMKIICQEAVDGWVDRHGRIMKSLAMVGYLQILQTHVPDLFQDNESHGQQTCSDQVPNLQRDLLVFSLQFDWHKSDDSKESLKKHHFSDLLPSCDKKPPTRYFFSSNKRILRISKWAPRGKGLKVLSETHPQKKQW